MDVSIGQQFANALKGVKKIFVEWSLKQLKCRGKRLKDTKKKIEEI